MYRKNILARSLLAAAFALLCMMHTAAHAQTIEQRQAALRGIRRNLPLRETISPADWWIITKDYKALQLSAYKLRDALKDEKSPDYRSVKSSAGDIKKRAKRLRVYLVFPEIDADKQKTQPNVPTTLDDLRSEVDDVIKHISDFVTNPIFDNLRVLDVQQSERANRDLIEITRLSDIIKRSAELLTAN